MEWLFHYRHTATVPRPIIQADAVSQRSLMVAQGAQIERQSALRLEREQREHGERALLPDDTRA